jgi:hypothetical protein
MPAVMVGKKARRRSAVAKDAAADAAAAVPAHTQKKRRSSGVLLRPWMAMHPSELIPSPDAPCPTAPDASQPFLCKWCGWRKSPHSPCTLWEGADGILPSRTAAWIALPTLRKTPRPPYAVPNIGQTFADANPHAQRHRKVGVYLDAGGE